MPHELNTKCADETFPYVETRNAWQFSNSGRTSEGDFRRRHWSQRPSREVDCRRSYAGDWV